MQWNTQNAQLIWFTVTWKEGKKMIKNIDTKATPTTFIHFILYDVLLLWNHFILHFFLSLQSTIRRKSLMKPFFKEKKIKSFSLKSFMSRLYCDTIETRLFCYEIYVLSHFIRFVRSFVRSSVRSYAAYN